MNKKIIKKFIICIIQKIRFSNLNLNLNCICKLLSKYLIEISFEVK